LWRSRSSRCRCVVVRALYGLLAAAFIVTYCVRDLHSHCRTE
jgi:hypothetical protein